MKAQLPEKIKAQVYIDNEGHEVERDITEEAAKINEIITHLEEQQNTHGNSYTCVGEGCFPKTITLPKPEWWGFAISKDGVNYQNRDALMNGYMKALEACSKASGITFLLEDNT